MKVPLRRGAGALLGALLAMPGSAGPLPAWDGANAVGRQLVYLNDPSRPGIERGVAGRPIVGWIYYPARAAEASAEPVLPAAWAARYRVFLERRLGAAGAQALQALTTAARRDAPVIDGAGRFPVLVFAPGLNWLGTDYSALVEHLASHGYVVIAFSSAPVSPVLQLSDHRIVDSPRRGDDLLRTVADDIRFVVGQLERLDASPALAVKGRLDLARIGAIGHSAGGSAAVLAASGEKRIVAAVNLDGDYIGESALARPRQPVLYLSSEPPAMRGAPVAQWEQDRSEARRNRVWQAVRERSPQSERKYLPGFYHSNFQDAALLAKGLIPEDKRKDRYGTVDGLAGIRATEDAARGFFDKWLKRAAQ